MQLNRLDHVNIRTQNLAEMIKWYSDVLGLVSGKRPNFPFKGAWMYLGDFPVVHIVEFKDRDLVGAEEDLKLEHFAFAAQDRQACEDKLNQMNVPYRRVDIPLSNLTQINIWDPDGNHIHVDFRMDEQV